jgi:hypothetical protein
VVAVGGEPHRGDLGERMRVPEALAFGAILHGRCQVATDMMVGNLEPDPRANVI